MGKKPDGKRPGPEDVHVQLPKRVTCSCLFDSADGIESHQMHIRAGAKVNVS